MKSAFAIIRTELTKHRGPLLLAGALSLGLTLLILPTPFLTQAIIDVCLPQKDLPLLIRLMLVIFALILLQQGLSYYLDLFFLKTNEQIALSVKLKLLSQVLDAPLKQTGEMGRGYLMSTIDKDTDVIRLIMGDTLFGIIKDVLFFIAGTTALFFIHWKLALLCIVLLPVFIWASAYFGKQSRSRSKVYLEERAKYTYTLQESLEAIQTAKALTGQDYVRDTYETAATRELGAFLNHQRWNLGGNAILGLIGGLCPVLAIGYGAHEIIQNRLTLGALIAFNQFVAYLFGPTQRILGLKMALQSAMPAFDRLTDLLKLSTEKEVKHDGAIGTLEWRNLKFSYRDIPVLRSIDLKVKRGDIIGIKGPSGSGKTTLGRVLCGLIPAEAGQIFVGDVELSEPDSWLEYRGCCSMVEQDPFLFDVSVVENIIFTKPLPKQLARAQFCLEQAGAWEFVQPLEAALTTRAGVRGNRFSTGQKQRLALSRALFRGATLFVLDEPVANLDPVNTKYLIEAVRKLASEHMLIIISHDRGLLANCTRIYQMVDGRLVDKGSGKPDPPIEFD